MRHTRVMMAALIPVLMTVAAPVAAQTVANGPYYAMPAWAQKLPCSTLANCPRFVVLANWNSEAVLDRETGLVWQRTPRTSTSFQSHHEVICEANAVGERYGWRLPTKAELMTLGDPTNASPDFHLPPGHPFVVNVADGTVFWSADGDSPEVGESIDFRPVSLIDGSIDPGLLMIRGPSEMRLRAWCVRGPVS